MVSAHFFTPYLFCVFTFIYYLCTKNLKHKKSNYTDYVESND